jgi:outer membrane protein TolC
MSKFYLKFLLINTYFYLFIASSYSQNGFSTFLEKDSLYRYNSVLKVLDSLLKRSFSNGIRTDTAFYKSFGKAEVIDLNQMIYFALNNNPELKSMRFKIDAQQNLAEGKSYLPDPMVEVELDDIMTDFSRAGMINIYASQMIMFPGKLGLERKAVLNSSTMMEYELRDMAVKMINMVKMDYYDLFLVEQQLQVNRDNKLIVQNLITAAESRYSVGKGMQQEVFKSQIELSRRINEEYILNQKKRNLLADLTRLTKVIIDENTKINYSNIDINFLLDINNFKLENINKDKLVDFAFEHRADLKALQNKILMNKTELELSKINRLPDFNVKLGYKILPFEETNAFSVMLGFNIPIAPWTSGKYDYAIQKNSLNVKSANEEYETKKNEIRNEINNAVNSFLSAKQTMRYYYTVLIPQTENSLKATQYNYETNMTDFLDLLDSYKMYQEAKLMFYDSLNMYLKMIADLEKATGMNLKNLDKNN